MKTRFNTRAIVVLLMVLLAIYLIVGCAANKPMWGDAKSGYILTYRLPKDHIWNYQNTTHQQTVQEMMGQSMEVNTDISTKYSIKRVGLDESKNIISNVKIESASIKSKSPQGEQTIDLSAIIGKTFALTFSQLGKKVEFDDPDNIKVDMGPAGKRSAEEFFKSFLPRLATQPVKIGGTWKVTKKDTVNQGGLEIAIDSETMNTLAGLETVDGIECLKITSKATITMEGSGQQRGADIFFEGDSDVNSTWYFAYKKGVFIKSNMEMLMEGTATVSGMNMTIPISQETKSEIKLVK